MEKSIVVENVSKEYLLGVIGSGTLYRDLQSWWAKLIGKEDPNSLIGSGVNRENQLTDRVLALDNISFEVEQGEVLGIIGGNGAGKSTILKILSRVTAPSAGKISYFGRMSSLLEVGTGFHPELTGRENIFLNGSLNGLNRKQVTTILDEIVEFSGVGQYLDTPVKRYSSGMYVRLGFAVAAHLEPDILVVDEVLAVGDASFQQKAIGKIQDVSQNEGRTVLFVSHNMASIQSLCTRALLLNKGKITSEGNPSEVVNFYLNSSTKNQPELDLDDLESAKEEKLFHGLKKFQINKIITFNDDRGPSLNFDSTEEIVVQVNFSCFVKVEDFRLMLYINLGDGTHLLSSVFSDDNSMKKYTSLKEGNYSWLCRIPKNTFGSNDYYFGVMALEHGVQHIRLENILKIRVNFSGYNDVLSLVNNVSPLKPQLKWEEINE